MIDFTALLYKTIGERIREARTAAQITQSGASIAIDNSLLSKIEHGKAQHKRNPYFLNPAQIKAICECGKLHLTPSKLVWGTDTDKKDLIKMWVLAILLNDSINPFSPDPLEEWIDKEYVYDPVQASALKANIAETSEKYGYFISSKRYALYELLKPAYNPEYAQVSNLILKQLMHDYEFSRHLFSRISNHVKLANPSGCANDILLERLMLRNNPYAVLIMDYGGIQYPGFILAFNKFWGKVESSYLHFFEDHLFSNDAVLLQNGLKMVQNTTINSLIVSHEFIQLNEKLLLLPEYNDSEAILASLNIRFDMIIALAENKDLDNNFDIDFYAHLGQVYKSFLEHTEQYFSIREARKEKL